MVITKLTDRPYPLSSNSQLLKSPLAIGIDLTGMPEIAQELLNYTPNWSERIYSTIKRRITKKSPSYHGLKAKIRSHGRVLNLVGLSKRKRKRAIKCLKTDLKRIIQYDPERSKLILDSLRFEKE